MIEINPFAPPATPAADPSSEDSNQYGIREFVTAFFINIPVYGILGFGTCNNAGRVGLVAALGVIFWGGVLICRSTPKAMSGIGVGGSVLALTQLIPLIQIRIGMFAIELCVRHAIWSPIGGGFLGGFSATLVAGLITACLAWMIGAFISLVTGHWPILRSKTRDSIRSEETMRE